MRLKQLVEKQEEQRTLDTHELLELVVSEPECHKKAAAVQDLFFDYLDQQFNPNMWTTKQLKSLRDKVLDEVTLLSRFRRVAIPTLISNMMRDVLILASGSVEKEEAKLGRALETEDYDRVRKQLKSAIVRFCHKPTFSCLCEHS